MKGLKEFRRSLNKDRTSGGRPGAQAPAVFMGVKNAVSIQPPKKVIRATRDYRSRAPQELSFSKGDFFHVLNDDNTNSEWLEATNPLTNARGLVPASYFDILSRGGRSGAPNSAGPVMQGGAGGPGPADAAGGGTAAGSSVVAKQGGGFYAVVKFDFAAERADELEASAGEPIIVIAQSNFEWFVAKPIGRLGGPGLIPVSFVELKDVTNGQKVENVDELISRGVIPKVEEWKKMTADYKKNTIPLGRFDFTSPGQAGAASATPNAASAPADGALGQGSSGAVPSTSPTVPPKDGPFGNNASGGMQSPTFDQQASSMPPELPPGMPPGEPLPTGIITSAQVDSFHFEQGDYWFRIQATHIAGPSPSAPPSAPTAAAGEERDLILYRLYEDFYEFQIALLDHFPAEAGRETQANGQPSERILPLMPGPLEQVDDFITSQRRQDLDTYIMELVSLPEYITRSELIRLFFEPRPGDHCTVQPLPDARAEGEGKQGAQEGGAKATEETGPNGQSNGTSKYSEDAPVGPGQSLGVDRSVDGVAQKFGNANLGVSQEMENGAESLEGRSSESAKPSSGVARKPARESYESRGSSMHAGTAANSAGAPTPAAPSPAFIKIKIFNRATDDLVAIRVPPSVTFNALMEKVKERLGDEIQVLRYRDADAGPNVMMRLSDDDDLRDFLATGDKLQLFADLR